MRDLFLLISLLWFVSIQPAANAEGEAYIRTVRVDWEAIPRAKIYEVQYFSQPSCSDASSKGAKILATKKPFARLDLAPGPFCFRVRGIGESEIKGEWSDFRGFDIPAPTPKEVKSAGRGRFKWNPIPNAEGYEVEIKDARGKTLVKTTTKTPELILPKKLVDDLKRRGEKVNVQVRSKIAGVELSKPSQSTLPASQVSVAPSVRELPPQPEPVLPEIEVVIERMRSLGERPSMPDPKDWLYANTPEKKENLRRRTIASSDIELTEELELSRSRPDLRVRLGTRVGSFFYGVKSSSGARSSDLRELSGVGELALDLNRHRPWGGFLHFSYRPWAREEDPVGFSQFAVGPTYRVALDSFWSSVFTMGVGFDFSTWSLFRDQPVAGPQALNTFATAGVKGWISGDWEFGKRIGMTILGEVKAYAGSIVAARNYRVSGVDLRVESRVGYQFTRSFGSYLGLSLGANLSSAVADGASLPEQEIRIYTTAISAGVTYDLDPQSKRTPAAERSMIREERKNFDVRLSAPLGFRSGVLVEATGEEASGSEFLYSGLLSGRMSFGRRSNWGLRMDAQLGSLLLDGALLATYDRFLFRRQDLKAGVYFGPFLYVDNLATGNEQQLDLLGLRVGFRVRKGLTRNLWGEIEAEFSAAALAQYGNEGRRGPGTFLTRVTPQIGLRVTPWLDFLIQYQLRINTFAIQSSDQNSTTDRAQGVGNFLSLGFSLKF